MYDLENKLSKIDSSLNHFWTQLDHVMFSNSEIITLLNSLCFNSSKNCVNENDYLNLIGKHLYSKSCIGGLYIYKVISAGRFLAPDDVSFNEGLLVINESFCQDCAGRTLKIGRKSYFNNVELVKLDEIGKDYFLTREEAENYFCNTTAKLRFDKLIVFRQDIMQNQRELDYSGCYILKVYKYNSEIYEYRSIDNYTKEDVISYIKNKDNVRITITSDIRENNSIVNYCISTNYDTFLEYEISELEEVNE